MRNFAPRVNRFRILEEDEDELSEPATELFNDDEINEGDNPAQKGILKISGNNKK